MEGQEYASTKTAYPIRTGIEGRHVHSHVFKICTDYGSISSRNRLLKYIEHFQRKTMTRGTKNKMKKVPPLRIPTGSLSTLPHFPSVDLSRTTLSSSISSLKGEENVQDRNRNDNQLKG